ncbi:10399_t:CDS:2, partial [Racocetra persica]
MTVKEKSEEEITNQDVASYDGYKDKFMEKRIIRKFDIYLLLDRANIGNAIVAGFTGKYLQSTALEFNLAVSAHLFGFVFFEILSSLVSKILGFHVWIPIIMVCWGTLSMCQAAVTSSLQLGIIRFLLGVAEAGFSPAVIDYICLFYSRKEVTMRYGAFMALSIIAGAFTGLLAYGIVQIKGTSLKSFQIIFLLEGIPTIILAAVVAAFFTKGPGNARFLTPEERRYTIDRLKPEGGIDEENRSVIKSQAKSAFFDPRVYVYILAATFGSIPFNALNFFLPTLVGQLGYNPVDTQLMRIAGTIATSATDPSLFKIRYFFTILIACGVYTTQPIVYSWLTCNILGQYKRNITIATSFTIGNIGGVVGILLFQQTMAPEFRNGMILSLSMIVAQFVLALLMKFHLNYENKKRDLATLSNNKIQLSESELKDTKFIKEKAAKLVEHEPKFDDILCDLHPNW